ncbi:hypothetical protein EGW08_007244, partial [Elysia chlorotica]
MVGPAAKLTTLRLDIGQSRLVQWRIVCLVAMLSLVPDMRCQQCGDYTATQTSARAHWLHGNTTCRRLVDGRGDYSMHRAAAPNSSSLAGLPLVQMHVHRV